MQRKRYQEKKQCTLKKKTGKRGNESEEIETYWERQR